MTTSPSEKKASDIQFNGIDIVKLIGAYMVCTIHVPPFDPQVYDAAIFSWINFFLKNCICRIAVPFYFASSGFLLFRKIDYLNPDTDRIRDYCLRNLRLLGTWVFLLFIGDTLQLWYLGALVIATLVLTFLITRGLSLRTVIAVSVIAYGIGLVGESYYGFIRPFKRFTPVRLVINGYKYFFPTTRNGLFFGLIFVLMGALFAWKHINMSRKTAVLGLIISLIMLFCEVFALHSFSEPRAYNMLVSLIPTTFFLFYLTIHTNIKNSPVYSRLRIIGVLVYFSHLFVEFLLLIGLKAVGSITGIHLDALHYIFLIVFTTLLAVMIERLSKKDQFRWLQYLYK